MTATTNSNGKRPAPFRDAVVADLEQEASAMDATSTREGMRLGENGCLEYTDQGVGSEILALSQLVRGGDPESLCRRVLHGDSTRDISDLMILLFVTRNTRGGKGEKELAYKMFLEVWQRYPKTAHKLLKLFPHYGYWKDLLFLMEKASTGDAESSDSFLKEAIALMQSQLQKDVDAMNQYNKKMEAATTLEEKEKLKKKGPVISLLTKWLPRENTHFDKKLGFVNRFTQHQPTASSKANTNTKAWKSKSKAHYRKTVAKLTAFLDLPEVLLSAQRFDEIQFHRLASKATFKLTRALLNETKDGQRRSEDPKRVRLAELFLDHVAKSGLKGGQLMPHEIVKEILQNSTVSPTREKVLDAQWKNLWKSVVDQVKAKAKDEGLEFDPTRMVPLSDVSGSMSGTPMMVSIALGIGTSEITHPAFRDMVLTFESEPRWHMLNAGDSIVKKVRSLAAAPWGGDTNFEAAYELILDVCLEHRLARDDVPSLIVFSDMQFNQADRGFAKTMHEVIGSKFEKVAKTLAWDDKDATPIVYWNLRNSRGHPVEKGTVGAVLLSGFSPSLLKLVMNGEALKEEEVEIVEMDGTVRKEKVRVTPEELLRKMLDDALYDPVREVLAQSKERALGDYGDLVSMGASLGAPVADGFEMI